MGEELVVAPAREVPLDPGAVRVVEHMAGETAGVHGRVMALAEEGGVVEVGGSMVDPVEEVVSVGVAPVSRTPESVACGHGKVF